MINKQKVKGVIVAAGYGTRFLPVTKTIPKEMLPLVNIPSIQFILDEFIASGINDILIITSRRKKALEDYFDREVELETAFKNQNAKKKLSLVTPPPVSAQFVRQSEMKGTGNALMLCESFASGSPVVVAYPDDIMIGSPPCALQLINNWRNSISDTNPLGCSVLSVVDLPEDDVSRYGVISPQKKGDVIYVRKMIEKPAPGTEPSHLVSLGRYLFTPELFPVLKKLSELPREGEFYQTEPINELAKQGKVIASVYRGKRYDTGEPIGYLKAFVEYALTKQEYHDELILFLRHILANEEVSS